MGLRFLDGTVQFQTLQTMIDDNIFGVAEAVKCFMATELKRIIKFKQQGYGKTKTSRCWLRV